MTISYAITVCNEFKELKRLVPLLNEFIRDEDEMVILFDKGKGTDQVWEYLQFCLQEYKNVKVKSETFKGHFAEWKNKLTSLTSSLNLILLILKFTFLFVSLIFFEIRLLNLSVSIPIVDKITVIVININTDNKTNLENNFFIIDF